MSSSIWGGEEIRPRHGPGHQDPPPLPHLEHAVGLRAVLGEPAERGEDLGGERGIRLRHAAEQHEVVVRRSLALERGPGVGRQARGPDEEQRLKVAEGEGGAKVEEAVCQRSMFHAQR